MFNCQQWAIRANSTFCAILRSSLRGRQFNSWGGGGCGWFLVIKNFFSSNLVGRIFFSLFSHELSFTFVLHAIFFFRQALAGIFFFQNHPPPSPQELNGRPVTRYIKVREKKSKTSKNADKQNIIETDGFNLLLPSTMHERNVWIQSFLL